MERKGTVKTDVEGASSLSLSLCVCAMGCTVHNRESNSNVISKSWNGRRSRAGEGDGVWMDQKSYQTEERETGGQTLEESAVGGLVFHRWLITF